MLTDASGSLVIKPCKPTESSFYESAAADHPDFAALMPTFYGRLALSTPEQKEALKHQDPMSINAALQAREGTAHMLVASDRSQPSDLSAKEPFGKKLDTDHAIVMENVSAGFVRPNTLDIKLGSRLWDDDAAPEKRQRLDQVAATTTSSTLGFRIAGMRVWNSSSNVATEGQPQGQYRAYDRMYGREFSAQNVHRAFEDFFFERNASKPRLTSNRRAVLELCEVELEAMEQVLVKTESRIYSASILFVYEGDNVALDKGLTTLETERAHRGDDLATGEEDQDDDEHEDSDDEDNETKIHDAKLIDFAHAHWTPGEGPDENMLKGVRSVRRILRQLLDTGNV